ncbi:hypothetical protein [Nocardioides caldifontis]|uniref:hypothetical protein n=1 Tax=Nocardioides caldifontis TaxID=2588938 RepID=UPI00193A1529|nr:hypothetical protein [Nocardioides caldifontis]
MTDDARLWHVTVTVAGSPMEPLIVRGALQRLSALRPFLTSLRFSADRAEIVYWDEAATLVDAASLALRLWNEYRDEAALPSWKVVGLEVVEQDTWQERLEPDNGPDLAVLPLHL